VVVAAPLTVVGGPPSSAPAQRSRSASLFSSCPGADIFDVLRAAPANVDLSPGVPDLGAFPRSAWLRAERAVLSDLPASALGYGDPGGTPQLRTTVAGWLGPEG
jgi:GntR family transcriptional regulator/MocR family aminotransferase